MEKTQSARSFGTHDGTFHADEVTSCALLLLFGLIDYAHIVRTRETEKLAKLEFVCDVGGVYDPTLKRFDHHQVSYEGEWSSAGMVLEYLRSEKIISEKLYRYFNRMLILGVDAHDNGKVRIEIGQASFSHLVSNFNPIRYDAPKTDVEQGFFEALDFVYGHLKRLLERFHYIEICRERVAKEMETDLQCLIFDEPLPWLESFFELGGDKHPALFVIMPSQGHWKLRGIPPSYADRMNLRCPLPHQWAGLKDLELKKASGIEGGVFCHKSLFISVWETKEDALKALKYTLEHRGE